MKVARRTVVILFSIMLAVTGVAGSSFGLENDPAVEDTTITVEQPVQTNEEEQISTEDESDNTVTENESSVEVKSDEDKPKAEAKVQEFIEKDSGITVTAIAPADAFPDGTTMTVRKVEDKDTIQTIRDTVNKENANITAVDISFKNGSGKEIQPDTPIQITIKSDSLAKAEDPIVVHVPDKGEPEKLTKRDNNIESDTEKKEVSFEADSFSVYAVVDDSTEEEARATVNFYNKAGTEILATVYVKNSDSLEDLESIVYDPGAGTLAEGDLFRGWSISTVNTTDGFSYDASTPTKDIGQVREFLEQANITEGDVYNIYPMIFRAYSVQFKDEDGVTIHSEVLINRTGEAVSYTINTPYTPKEQDSAFLGWNVTNIGSDNINPAPSAMPDSLYPNGTTVEISGNVIFAPDAPEGYWLVFNENGSGVSYTAPQFIRQGNTPTAPDDPSRLGYSFGGWYSNADGTGATFDFNQPLTQRTTVYARWIANPTAEYTVIIWQQQTTGDKYDFVQSIRLTGNTNAVINSISQRGSGNNTYARINGTDYQYTGFHLKEYDQNKTVSPDGTTVVNVYYDRNEYTLTFQAPTQATASEGDRPYVYVYNEGDGTTLERTRLYYHNGRWYTNRSGFWNYTYSGEYTGGVYSNNTYSTVKTITARYGADISSDFPIVGTNGVTYDSGERWKPQSNNVGLNDVILQIRTMPAGNVTFRLSYPERPLKTMNYYVEALSTDTGTVTAPNPLYKDGATNTQVDPGNMRFKLQFTLNARYNGVTVEDLMELEGYEFLGVNERADDEGRYIWNTTQNGTINIYYIRDKYKIIYNDGKYVDGDGVDITGATIREHIYESNDINFGASLADQKDAYNPTLEGYSFAGWFIDDACTQAFDFDNSTMPKGGISLYAKWVQTQYRVFMHPNVPSSDTSLDWGGQAMCFRVDYGDKIAGGNTIIGTRDDYDIIGWYTDEACTEPFNFDAYVLNDTTVTTPYYRTEPNNLDKYGNPIGTSNSDAANNRTWINYKLDLYAKWRAKLNGARGINVVYDANESEEVTGKNPPIDSLDYLDNTEAVAGAASTPDDESQQFLYWVVQHWDETQNKYVDTAKKVYPGDTFTVLKSNARVEDRTPTQDDPSTKVYTVQLRAEYGPKDVPADTHITWYGNGGTIDGNNTTSNINLQINEAVDIIDGSKLSKSGYKFIGWSRQVEPEGAFNNGSVDVSKYTEKELTSDDLFLVYHEAEGDTAAYYTYGSNTVSKVAADENDPYHALYAVWERATYNVIIRKHIDGVYSDPTKEFTFTATMGSTQSTFTLTDYNDELENQELYSNIDYGTTFSVTETTDGYTAYPITVKKYSDAELSNLISETNINNGDSITVDSYVLIEYTNYLDIVITGVRDGNPLYVLPLITLSAILLLLGYTYLRYRRRRDYADEE